VIIQRPTSRQKLYFINRFNGRTDFDLYFHSLDKTLFTTDGNTSTSTGNTTVDNTTAQKAGGGSGGCFVATASFGSMEHPFVKILCSFRDRVLLSTGLGEYLVQKYYQYSPPIAAFIAESFGLRILGQLLLLPLVLLAWLLINPVWMLLLVCLVYRVFWKRIRA
jgi:hypothetical protein